MKNYTFKRARLSRSLCLVAIVLIVEPTLVAQTPPLIEWEQSFGGHTEDNCHSVVATRDGGFLFAGDSTSGISGSKTTENYGGLDSWAVRVGPAGEQLWDISFGGDGGEGILSVAVTGDDGFLLAGWSTSGISGNKTTRSYGNADFWLVKVDANGNKVWEKVFGGSSYDFLSTIVATGDGGFLLAGSSSSGVSGNKTSANYGGYDLWLVKVDADGTKLWDKSFGGSGQEGDDPPVPQVVVALLEDGGFLLGTSSNSRVSGNKSTPSFGGADYWLVKVDGSGNKLWDRSYGGSANDFLYDVAPTAEGGFLLGGHSASGISGNKASAGFGLRDAWLVKVDANGTKLWDKSFSGSGEDLLHSIASTGDGGFLLAGYRACYPRCGDSDYWIVKIDASGKRLWDRSYGGSAYEEFLSLAATGDGGFLLGGTSNSDISGTKSSPKYGGDDFWVIKLAGPPPKVSIERSGSSVRLSWPLFASDYLVEQTSNLKAPLEATSWSEVPGPHETDETANFLTLEAPTENAFYRLRKP